MSFYETRAFLTYVRPLVEYNSVVWSPYRKGDILAIENVQRRFTKRIPGFLRVVIESVCHCLNSLVWSYVGLDLIFFGLS